MISILFGIGFVFILVAWFLDHTDLKLRKDLAELKTEYYKDIETINDEAIGEYLKIQRSDKRLVSLYQESSKVQTDLLDQYRDALNFIDLVGCDYDGYEDVAGLKKTIDRMVDVAKNREMEKSYTESEWKNEEGIPTTVSDIQVATDNVVAPQ